MTTCFSTELSRLKCLLLWRQCCHLFFFFTLFPRSIEAEGDETTAHDPHSNAQAVIDLLAVFGAMFVAGVAIILITVYFR